MLISYFVYTLIVAAAVSIHFEMLNWLAVKVPEMTLRNRVRVVVALLGAILAHLVEIWLFAFAYYVIDQSQCLVIGEENNVVKLRVPPGQARDTQINLRTKQLNPIQGIAVWKHQITGIK